MANIAKHGISFEDAVSVFRDPLAKIFVDPAHSWSERRELIIGYSERGRLVVLSFIQREQVIRIISARYATPRERRRHEQNTKD